MSTNRIDRPFGGSTNAQYALLGLAVATGVYIWWATGNPRNPPPHPTPVMVEGAVIDAPITLVTADKFDLACASETKINDLHCEFETPEKPFSTKSVQEMSPAERKLLLAPYKTIDDILVFIPGLFEDPTVNERFQDELPQRRQRDKLQRFTAQCKLKLVKEVDGFRMRWAPKADWQPPQKAWIGIPESCQVSEP